MGHRIRELSRKRFLFAYPNSLILLNCKMGNNIIFQIFPKLAVRNQRTLTLTRPTIESKDKNSNNTNTKPNCHFLIELCHDTSPTEILLYLSKSIEIIEQQEGAHDGSHNHRAPPLFIGHSS